MKKWMLTMLVVCLLFGAAGCEPEEIDKIAEQVPAITETGQVIITAATPIIQQVIPGWAMIVGAVQGIGAIALAISTAWLKWRKTQVEKEKVQIKKERAQTETALIEVVKGGEIFKREINDGGTIREFQRAQDTAQAAAATTRIVTAIREGL